MRKSVWDIPALARLLPYSAAGLLLCAACSGNECLDNKTTMPKVEFYSAGEEPKVVWLDSVLVYGIGAPGDRQLTDTTDRFESVMLPFRLDSDTTRYVFRYLQSHLREAGVTDTVTFIYGRQPWFVSSACGVSMRFNIKWFSCTRNVMDSIACMTPVVDNQDLVNFRVFVRVAEEEEPVPDPGEDVPDEPNLSEP